MYSNSSHKEKGLNKDSWLQPMGSLREHNHLPGVLLLRHLKGAWTHQHCQSFVTGK